MNFEPSAAFTHNIAQHPEFQEMNASVRGVQKKLMDGGKTLDRTLVMMSDSAPEIDISPKIMVDKIGRYLAKQTPSVQRDLENFEQVIQHLKSSDSSIFHAPPKPYSEFESVEVDFAGAGGTNDFYLAKKLTRAIVWAQSKNLAVQLVGRNQLKSISNMMKAERAINERMHRGSLMQDPQRCESLFRQGRTLIDSCERLYRENEEPSVHDLHRFIDKIEVYRSKIVGMDVEDRMHKDYLLMDGLQTAFFGAYGSHVYDKLAHAVQAPLFHDRGRVSYEIDRVLSFDRDVEMSTSRVLFFEKPCIENFDSYMRACENALPRAFLGVNTLLLGQAAFSLDSSTAIFATNMKRITQYQRQEIERQNAHLRRANKRVAALTESAIKNGVSTKTEAVEPLQTIDLALEPEYLPEHIEKQIHAAQASGRASVRAEGELADVIAKNYAMFASVVGMNEKFARVDGSTLGETDIRLDNAIVECTLRTHGKERQLHKLSTDTAINPFLKSVILYAPNYSEQAQAKLPERVLFAANPSELGTALFALRAREIGFVS